ncbi:MAG: hypothetical protein ACOC82_03570, partial [Candidatus Bipolaricaulota bacterium]
MKEKIAEELISIAGADWVVTDPVNLQEYLYDETPKSVRPQASDDVVLVKPNCAEEISRILELANAEEITV